MLYELKQLSLKADGRYAEDTELAFFQDYLKTAQLRFRLYQKIQKLEPQLVQKVLAILKATNPALLQVQGRDHTEKCQRDTTLVIRAAASALLTDDPELFNENLLIWLQNIMRVYKTESGIDETYKIILAVLKQALTPEEAALFCPLIEMCRSSLNEAM